MDPMDDSLIQLQVENGIATLTFNRPEKRNAMSDEMRGQFIHAQIGRAHV